LLNRSTACSNASIREAIVFRLVNKDMRELLVLHFSKGIVFLNCLLVSAAGIALISILNALSPSLKNPF
jgi:hypothetical protein